MPPRVSPKPKAIELFISYAHLNATWFDRLRPILKFEGCRESAYAWNDQQMKAGDRWDKKIREALERMDVFVCLVSIEFLTSSYIREVELKRAFQREANNEIEIVPIMIYPNIDLKQECRKLIEFQQLPIQDKSWREFEVERGDYGDANGLIRKGLWQAIENAQGRR